MTAKFMGDFHLLEACQQSGCPICRCLESDCRRHMDALIYEHVNDPDTRASLRASWGFCNWHTWMLVEVEGAVTGAAIVYEDLLGTVLRRVRRVSGRTISAGTLARRVYGVFVGRRSGIATRYERRLTCPICLHSRRGEARYVDAALHGIGDPEFDRAYEKSDGICLPHLLQAVERDRRRRAADDLVARTLAKWQALRDDLQRFVRKQDYRNTEPFTEAEASSSTRAFEALVGRRAVFGNELHRHGRPDVIRARRPGA